MTLKSIDKSAYRRRFNRLLVIGILAFAGLSLGIAQLAIFLFTDGVGSHFAINLVGVILAMLIVGQSINKIKHQPYMAEIVYVWELKQQINRIQRKIIPLEKACEEKDPKALLIMEFYCKACRQLYLLDDNTITMEELTVKANKINVLLEEVKPNSELTYDLNWLTAY